MVEMVEQDQKFQSQLVELKDEVRRKNWDLFMTLNFRRHISIEKGHKLIDQWDRSVSRYSNGRRFNRSSKRMKFFGCLSYNEGRRVNGSMLKSNPLSIDGTTRILPDTTTKSTPYSISNPLRDERHLHSHLLIDLPLGVEIDRFIDVCETMFGRVLNKTTFQVYRDKMVHTSIDDLDVQGVHQVTDYIVQERHIGKDESGLLDSGNVVISRNWGINRS